MGMPSTILLAEVSSEGLRAKHKHSASGKMVRLFLGLEHPEDPCEYLLPGLEQFQLRLVPFHRVGPED